MTQGADIHSPTQNRHLTTAAVPILADRACTLVMCPVLPPWTVRPYPYPMDVPLSSP